MSTMVYPRDEKLSQEDIISNTKVVMQGLEALKNEHNSILHSLLETISCLKKDEEANLVHEKSNLIRKSVEMIELGLGEAQVPAGGEGAAGEEEEREQLEGEGEREREWREGGRERERERLEGGS
ncbi:hypothetical protein scyTo_0027830, partial [Scyliorhinus torazame]|nr:hypothetical protein [Scyliorhinus torazame]